MSLTSQIILYVTLGLTLATIATIYIAVVPTKTWFTAIISGCHISMKKLTAMKLRKLKISYLVNAYIQAKKAGLKIDLNDIETHHLAGGDIEKVISAMISAKSAKFPLSFELAKALDLTGKDIMHAIKLSITPTIVETDYISAVAKNGMELKIKTKITLKANMTQIVGGAGEETILARVAEGIVKVVGQAENHHLVLENPDIVSKAISENNLTEGTYYEIISIDISEMNIGKNIASKLIVDKAESDKLISQAKAQERLANAQAAEMEMKVRAQEMKTMVLAAEAEVPKALADAIKKGQIGVMDYYKLQNINSDTAMRKSLAGIDPNGTGSKGNNPRGIG